MKRTKFQKIKFFINTILRRNKDAIIYVMIGLPGSGKTTWIKQNLENIDIVSRDTIRAEMGICNHGEKAVGTILQEKEVTKREYDKITKLCKSKKPFVIDDTNLRIKYRNNLMTLFKKYIGFYRIAYVYINTPLSLCIKRRTGEIDPSIIANMSRNFALPTSDEYDFLIESLSYKISPDYIDINKKNDTKD